LYVTLKIAESLTPFSPSARFSLNAWGEAQYFSREKSNSPKGRDRNPARGIQGLGLREPVPAQPDAP
jgi:hypothetical protein